VLWIHSSNILICREDDILIDILRKQIESGRTREEKINHLREFLQILILKIIYDTGYFKNLSFAGGTALRILYDLRRFSEDLDFSLFKKAHFDFEVFAGRLKNQLELYGLEIELKTGESNIVKTIDIRFKNILMPLTLSSHKGEKLFVRIEIDSNPPRGAKTEISLINRTYVFTVTHLDLPSLYATKLHACFFRGFVKGRDFYDLLWYLGKKTKPNLKLFRSAIRQTHPEYPLVTERNFKEFMRKELEKIDFKKARQDVSRFIEDKEELRLIERDVFLKILM